MHESLLKCKCDAMHEHIRSFKQSPTQKFCKNLINFSKKKKKNPQNFSKKKNLDLYEWNGIKRGKTRSYLWREEQYRSKNEWGRGLEWEKWVGGGEESEPIERDRKKREKIALRLYIGNHDSRWIERCWDLNLPDGAIEELSRGVHNKVTSMNREAIKHLSSIQKLPR